MVKPQRWHLRLLNGNNMFDHHLSDLFTFGNLLALLTLTSLEIVLGFDNVVMISILVDKLEAAKQDSARRLGIILAMLMRIILLFCISWVMLLTEPLFGLFGKEFSGKSLILLAGGMFLIAKATFEIHHNVEDAGDNSQKPKGKLKSYWAVIGQILLLDLVFSIDSVITAVGMASHIIVMVIAVLASVALMLIFAKRIGDFIKAHPTFKILALSFLVLVGVLLVAEGLGQHIDKGYIYFAMSFSLIVEFLNLKIRSKAHKAKV